jgi:hypothetical protein
MTLITASRVISMVSLGYRLLYITRFVISKASLHHTSFDKLQDEILVTDEAPGGFVVLNRARRMNAVDLTTVRLLDEQMRVCLILFG